MNYLAPLMVSVLMAGCVTIDQMIGNKSVDENLVGIWSGEYEKQDGTHIAWTQVRNEEGSYLTFFKVRESSGNTSESVESGNWWVEDKLFHEINPKLAKEPFVYKYSFYHSNCLKFEQAQLDETMSDQGQYSFTECEKGKTP